MISWHDRETVFLGLDGATLPTFQHVFERGPFGFILLVDCMLWRCAISRLLAKTVAFEILFLLASVSHSPPEKSVTVWVTEGTGVSCGVHRCFHPSPPNPDLLKRGFMPSSSLIRSGGRVVQPSVRLI